MDATSKDPPSPCTSVCDFSFTDGVCTSCYRTLDEIARWGAMTPEQKQAVLARVRERHDGSR